MTIMLRALLLAAILCVAGEAHAQNWPTRPVKLIVPTGAGHAVDIMARMLSTGVSKTLGQTVFIENMPGASGFIGAQATARAEPDGYTFLFAPASLLTTNMFLFKSLPYDPTKDFAAVAMVCDKGPMTVTVNPDLPVKTIPELIAYGKANPGKLSYAVDATAGFGVATGRLVNKRGQIGMVEVPYRSSPQMAQDTISGTTQLMFGSVPPVVGPVKAGKLRWIAVSSEQRFPGMEDVPTIAETLPGFRIDGWFVVLAPAGTPAPILQKLNHEIDAVFKSPEIRARALNFGLGVSDAGTPESTQAFIRFEQDRWRGLVAELGMEAQ
jgi:tripartite-type tricarboxylate transporter receptor subunit TctC